MLICLSEISIPFYSDMTMVQTLQWRISSKKQMFLYLKDTIPRPLGSVGVCSSCLSSQNICPNVTKKLKRSLMMIVAINMYLSSKSTIWLTFLCVSRNVWEWNLLYLWSEDSCITKWLSVSVNISVMGPKRFKNTLACYYVNNYNFIHGRTEFLANISNYEGVNIF